MNIKEFAKKNGLKSENDGILDYVESHITVFVNDMSKKQYEKMEKNINTFLIRRKEYKIYVWNDGSGYNYWKKEGENDEPNYIQISVSIHPSFRNKVYDIDVMKLIKDIQTTFDHFIKYDNLINHNFHS